MAGPEDQILVALLIPSFMFFYGIARRGGFEFQKLSDDITAHQRGGADSDELYSRTAWAVEYHGISLMSLVGFLMAIGWSANAVLNWFALPDWTILVLLFLIGAVGVGLAWADSKTAATVNQRKRLLDRQLPPGPARRIAAPRLDSPGKRDR